MSRPDAGNFAWQLTRAQVDPGFSEDLIGDLFHEHEKSSV